MLDKSFSMHENHQLEISKRAIEVVVQQFAGAWDRIGASRYSHTYVSAHYDSYVTIPADTRAHMWRQI